MFDSTVEMELRPSVMLWKLERVIPNTLPTMVRMVKLWDTITRMSSS